MTLTTLYDPASPDFRVAAHDISRTMRGEFPLYEDRNGRFFALSRYADVRAVTLDWELTAIYLPWKHLSRAARTAMTDSVPTPRRVAPSDAPMTVFDAIYSLRATRIYQDRPVPPEVLDQIVQAGTMACSSGNTQPWEFVVVTDPEIKQRIKDEMVIGFSTIDEERAQTPDQLVDGVGRSITGHAAVDNIDRVPAIVVVCWNPERGIRMKGEYETLPDGSLRSTREIPGGRGVSLFQACQNMMLAGRALEVDSLFTTFFFLRREQIKEILGIPRQIFMECAVFFGYRDEPLGKPRRKPLDEVAHVNRWGAPYAITVDQ